MLFRTEIPQINWPFQVDHSWPVVQLGSCFSQHISEKLKRGLFHVAPNPFGTSYNPISLANQIEKLLSDSLYTRADLSVNNDLHFSFDHYTAFSHGDTEWTLQNINKPLNDTRQLLDSGSEPGILLITLGTAQAWKHKASDSVVNNCHKLPGHLFDRIFIEPEEIEHRLKTSLTHFHERTPHWKVLLSVSPVRHIRDGLTENQRSKAALILAAQRLASQLGFVHYFPAYEIMMDDLRDYRFYGADLIHPNSQAIEYIWEYFSAGLLTEDAQQILEQVAKLRRFFEHRSAHQKGAQHQAQRQTQLNKLELLQKAHPALNWSYFDIENRI